MIPSRSLLAMLVAYITLVIGVIWGLLETRDWVLATYATPVEEENWREFRDALQEGKNEPLSTVKRPTQRGDEPPIKIFFADNFPQVVVWLVVFLSILYWTVGIMLIGAIRTPNQVPAQRSPDTDV